MSYIDDVAQAGWQNPTRTLASGSASIPTTYTQRVVAAIWSYIIRTLSGEAPDTTPPAAPVGVVALGGTNRNIVHWTANTEGDFNHYRIYREVDGGSYSLLTSVNTNNYNDTDVSTSSAYTYKITAIDNSNNESSQSSASGSVSPHAPSGGGAKLTPYHISRRGYHGSKSNSVWE